MALPFPGVVCLSSTGAKIHTCTTETSWSQASSSILCLCFKLFITFTASVTERMVSSIFWRSLWYSSCLFSKMKPKWFHCNIVSGGLTLSALQLPAAADGGSWGDQRRLSGKTEQTSGQAQRAIHKRRQRVAHLVSWGELSAHCPNAAA